MTGRQPFVLYECGLARQGCAASCSTLDDLLRAVKTESDSVIEHHMMRCVLEDHFELHEFPNDLARWCWDSLGDHVLGEQLGLVDPYRHASIASLRESLASMITDRVDHQEVPLVCRPGLELQLMRSRLIAYPTDESFATPVALAEALPSFSLASIFFHVHEARRRSDNRTDDFSQWLEECDSDPGIVASIRGIDFYFLNLHQLRDELQRVFHRFMPDAPSVTGAAA
ncbi:MAG TPA: DUF5752 family protein [Gemmatimonadales bacterium]|jgi:hypothetical protein